MPKNTAKKATPKTSQIKGVTTLDAGNGLIVEVIETAKREATPTAKKTPPTPKKKQPAATNGVEVASVTPGESKLTDKGQEIAAKLIRKPQLRILAYLAKQKRPSTRKQIADGAPVDTAMCTEYLGSDNDAIRLKNDAKHFPSLVTLGYIAARSPATRSDAATPGDGDEQQRSSAMQSGAPVTTYTITDAGREALKTAAK